MIPEQRKRAAGAVQARMDELRLSVPRLARRAGVDAGTVRSLLAGRRWPGLATRERICAALNWPPGEIARRAIDDPAVRLEAIPTANLLAELLRRCEATGDM